MAFYQKCESALCLGDLHFQHRLLLQKDKVYCSAYRLWSNIGWLTRVVLLATDVDEQSKKEIKDILLAYDRTLLVADPRRCEPKKCAFQPTRHPEPLLPDTRLWAA